LRLIVEDLEYGIVNFEMKGQRQLNAQTYKCKHMNLIVI